MSICTMFSPTRGAAAAALVALAMVARIAPARAQAAPSGPAALSRQVDLHYKQQSMAAMLHDLAQRYGVAVIADGAPRLAAADLEFSGTLREALDRVADLFDYSVDVGKSGIARLAKRFKDPKEMPQMIPAEIHQTAADMLTILPVLPFDTGVPPSWVRLLRSLALQLSPAEVAVMKEGRRLHLTDLVQDERPIVAQVVLLRAYGVARSDWELLYRQTDRFDSTKLRAVKRGVFTSVDGKETAYYDIVHEAKGPNGGETQTVLGGFRREVKP